MKVLKECDVILIGKGERYTKDYAIIEPNDSVEEWFEEGDQVLKAKLIIQEPEKKITMSESEFKQLYKSLCREAYQQKSAGDMWEPDKYMEYVLKFEEKE